MQKSNRKVPSTLTECNTVYVLAYCSNGFPVSHKYTVERYAKQFEVEGYKTLIRMFNGKLWLYTSRTRCNFLTGDR